MFIVKNASFQPNNRREIHTGACCLQLKSVLSSECFISQHKKYIRFRVNIWCKQSVLTAKSSWALAAQQEVLKGAFVR